MDWEGCPKASPIQHNATLPLSFPLMSLDSLTAQLQVPSLTIGSRPVDSFLLGRTAACLVKKDAGAKQSQSYLIHFYTDVYLRRYARSSPRTMFFVEVGLISFTFTLTSIQVGMLAPLVVGPGGLFLDAGVWVRLHPSRSSLGPGDCFSTLACGCACTPPARRWFRGIVSRRWRVGALAPLPLVVGSGGFFLDAGVWVHLHPSCSLLGLGDCFSTPACVGALAPLPLFVGSGGLFVMVPVYAHSNLQYCLSPSRSHVSFFC